MTLLTPFSSGSVEEMEEDDVHPPSPTCHPTEPMEWEGVSEEFSASPLHFSIIIEKKTIYTIFLDVHYGTEEMVQSIIVSFLFNPGPVFYSGDQ